MAEICESCRVFDVELRVNQFGVRAARAGHLPCLAFLTQRGYPISGEVYSTFLERNQLEEFFQLDHSGMGEVNQKLWTRLVKYGQPAQYEIALARYPLNVDSISELLMFHLTDQRLALIPMFWNQCRPQQQERIRTFLISRKQNACFRFLVEHGYYQLSHLSIQEVLHKGNVELLDYHFTHWIGREQMKVPQFLVQAFQYGSIEIAKYILAQELVVDYHQVANSAFACGPLSFVRQLLPLIRPHLDGLVIQTYYAAFNNEMEDTLLYLYRQRIGDSVKLYSQLKEQLLAENLLIFTHYPVIHRCLSRWITDYLHRRYAPNGPGYSAARQHFSSLTSG